MEDELAVADRHIADLKAKIVRQRQIVARFDGEGRKLLANMEDALAALERHRELIVERLGGGG